MKPGDFQLGSREVWIEVRGYEEDILTWGMNDKRLVQKASGSPGLKFQNLGQLGFTVFHLEHKLASHPHNAWEHRNTQENLDLTLSYTTGNREDWGTKIVFEEIKL